MTVPRDASVTLRSVSGTVKVTSVNGELPAESAAAASSLLQEEAPDGKTVSGTWRSPTPRPTNWAFQRQRQRDRQSVEGESLRHANP